MICGLNMSEILIVDDNEKGLDLLEKILVKNNYLIRRAMNGREALSRIETKIPDLVLLDIQMPEMNGFETIAKIKQNTAWRDIPVIFLTSQADSAEIDQGFSLGASDYILKPARSRELLARIRTHLELASKTSILKAENKKLFEQKISLLQFFSDDVAEAIIQGKMGEKMKGEIIPVTVFFLDIRNFSGISEKLKPELLADLLNTLFTDIMDIVFTNHGSVNKLIGDAVLATFGAPLQTGNDAMNAVKCALDVQEMITLFNKAKPEYLQDDIRVGIGIASGDVFAGNIGSYRRIEYTVIGDTVNTASRLESLTKTAGHNIIIDEKTAQMLDQEIKSCFLAETDVKGKKQKVKIYSIEYTQGSGKKESEAEVTFF